MNHFRIVADSSCDLLTLNGADFVSVPLTIRTETEEFRDDDSLDVEAMVNILRSRSGRTYSSCPNVADWEEAFGESGDIIAFTITSGLSGSYNTACAAKKSCQERAPSRRIHVVDSLSAGPEIVLLIERAHTAQQFGACTDEAFMAVKKYQSHTRLIFALESMHNLAQNGRISKLTAKMAGVLGIRAIGEANAEGKLSMLGKCRGARRTRHFMLEKMAELGYMGGKVRVGHCKNEEFALELRAAILERFLHADVKVYPLRGLCSYYAEYGGIMVGFESCPGERQEAASAHLHHHSLWQAF